MIVMFVLGIVFLALGGGLWVFLARDPLMGLGAAITAFTFIPMGALFVLIGLVGMRSVGRDRRILRTGLRGVATVLSATDTGMSINQAPLVDLDLSVDLPGQEPHQRTMRTRVPRLAVSRVTPGSMLPVVVDPTDPSKLLIDWSAPVPFAGFQPGSIPSAATLGEASRERGRDPLMAQEAQETSTSAPSSGGYELLGRDAEKRLAATGLTAQATIDRFDDTEITLEGRAVMAFDLTVTLPGRPPYPVRRALTVPPDAFRRLAPGASVPVRVDPLDPQAVLIDWSRA